MEPIAPISAIPAASYLPIGAGGLTVGAIVQARVARVDGDAAWLRWGEQTVAVSSQVPLTVGQQVNLLVEEGSTGKILLRMVDETFGKGRPARTEGSGSGRGSGPSATSTGTRGMPTVSGLPGRADRDAGASPGGGQGFADPQAEWGLTDELGNRTTRPPGGALPTDSDPTLPLPFSRFASSTGPLRFAGSPRRESGPGGRGDEGAPRLGGEGRANYLGSQAGSQAPRTRPALSLDDPLASLLFEQIADADPTMAGATIRLGAPIAPADDAEVPDASAEASTPTPMPRPAERAAGPAGTTGLLARAAMPTYGRLAQSVGGDDAFGTLLATLGRDAGQTIARAPLAPADLGRLLVEVGVHPDEMNAVLVSEMLSQGMPVNEATVRTLRRDLALAGGDSPDAASTVLLSRLGLPVTPLSLAIARQVLAGQLDPKAAWADALGQLRRLAQGAGGSEAATIARDLLAEWRVPLEEGANGVGRWLRAVVDQAALPLEAKVARSLVISGEPAPLGRAADRSAAAPFGQDVRARLDGLTQTLAARTQALQWGSPGQDPASPALQRLQATIQAEQVLNAGVRETGGQRFFAVTLPALMGQQPTGLEIQVRERDARSPEAAEVHRPDVVRLKLSLPNLGDVAVNLTVGQSSVACHFAATTSFSEALLGASAGELIGRLKHLGYQQTTVETTQQPARAVSAARTPRPEPARRVQHVDMRA